MLYSWYLFSGNFVESKLNEMKLKIDEEVNFVKVLKFDKVCQRLKNNPTGF